MKNKIDKNKMKKDANEIVVNEFLLASENLSLEKRRKIENKIEAIMDRYSYDLELMFKFNSEIEKVISEKMLTIN